MLKFSILKLIEAQKRLKAKEVFKINEDNYKEWMGYT
jgi:hypothetical protein